MAEIGDTILRLEGVVKEFPIRAGLFRRVIGQVHAVSGVDLALRENETLGVVGESGCGKTTLGRTILRLIEPTAGHIYYKGEDVAVASKHRMRELRKELQIVFQDPYASLNPRMPVREIIGEPLTIRIKSVFGDPRYGWAIPEAARTWRLDPAACGGGPIVFDDGHHKFALAWWLMGMPEEVHAWIGRTEVEGGTVDGPAMISFRWMKSNAAIA